ncbi:hypothetical protein ACN4EE_11910 [Geminocystis sp. CENA526]|uniref:hypothetical protein n=1 Tax=Geminocystis sp. CENA526 TaxID=1355871 RepID=UPI003D6FE142
MLNKLFGKKKSQDYFFEAPATPETVASEETTTETSETATSEEAKSAPVAVKSANVSYDVPDWVKAIKNYSNQNNGSTSVSETNNYAGKYVTNNVPQSRRRPGPSLAGFKAMASQIGK